MTPDREKLALEALREARTDLLLTAGNADHAAQRDGVWAGVGEKLRIRIRQVDEALAALAETAPSGEVEPVAYRWRWIGDDCIGDWKFAPNKQDGLDPTKYEQEPLYAHPAPTPSASEDRAGEVCGYLWEAAYEGEPLTGSWIFSRRPPIHDRRATAFAIEPLVFASALTARDKTIARLTWERDEARAERRFWEDAKRKLESEQYEAAQERQKREAAEARLAVMGEALRPFADIADLADSETEGLDDGDEFELMFHDYLMERFTLFKFRLARAALEQEGRAG